MGVVAGVRVQMRGEPQVPVAVRSMWTGVAGGGGEERGEAVAELGQRGGEGEQAGGDGGAGEVQGVAVGVEVAVEEGGLLAAQVEGGGGEQEGGVRAGGCGRGLVGGVAAGLVGAGAEGAGS